MPYTSLVYNVMLASPSDVNDECAAAREIILDWNNINSSTRNIVLLPVSWKLNAIPTMGDRPQEIINKQVLKNADLLVGIFWTRIGTPTGKAISGSVEEIEEHINSGKPAMLYFSNKPVPPSNIDQNQFEAVKKLKEEYQSKGLTDTFNNIEDFNNKFQRHLAMKINSDGYFMGYKSEQITEIKGITVQEELLKSLSNEAKTLLLEASNDMNGQIMKFATMGGFEIQTNGKQFVKKSDPRSKALWISVLDELENEQLIISLGYKHEIFELTYLGYKIVESLNKTE